MKPSLPLLLSLNGGYVDTAGFLALHGLFTTHVTGNFVTLGAALVQGSSGAVAKLLALPVFWVGGAFYRDDAGRRDGDPECHPSNSHGIVAADDHHDGQYRSNHDRSCRFDARCTRGRARCPSVAPVTVVEQS